MEAHSLLGKSNLESDHGSSKELMILASFEASQLWAPAKSIPWINAKKFQAFIWHHHTMTLRRMTSLGPRCFAASCAAHHFIMEEPSGAMGCFSQLLHMPHEVCAGIVWSLGVEDTAKLASSCKLFAQETLALKVQSQPRNECRMCYTWNYLYTYWHQ